MTHLIYAAHTIEIPKTPTSIYDSPRRWNRSPCCLPGEDLRGGVADDLSRLFRPDDAHRIGHRLVHFIRIVGVFNVRRPYLLRQPHSPRHLLQKKLMRRRGEDVKDLASGPNREVAQSRSDSDERPAKDLLRRRGIIPDVPTR